MSLSRSACASGAAAAQCSVVTYRDWPSPQLSFTREVEIIASTLQPASTVHNFTFTLPAPSTPFAPSQSTDMLRASVLTTTTDVSYAYPYADDPFTRHARPSSVTPT